ncbi:hypothetical protein [Lignipirellula cremea]|uniref:Uncharacterized protein n=1 Tax=Lignipirellula cremea TaxID=2528010 RepID=A0A518DQ44_9BACT|nr:hypothetical protein [Lignipirellula cremea]QDU93924.1 hypothetical protein Pla8534_17100 [Lignipirellula cremea]
MPTTSLDSGPTITAIVVSFALWHGLGLLFLAAFHYQALSGPAFLSLLALLSTIAILNWMWLAWKVLRRSPPERGKRRLSWTFCARPLGRTAVYEEFTVTRTLRIDGVCQEIIPRTEVRPQD